MPVYTCEPCEDCNPDQFARSQDTYRQAVLHILCEILAASGGGMAANDNEFEILCDTDTVAETLITFLRRYVVTPAGTVTTVDTELDGLTAYAVTGTVGPCDVEYTYVSDCFVALADSPVDYPEPGDPVGTAYGVGDTITWNEGFRNDNVLADSLFIITTNLSNGNYPAPFWVSIDGVDLFGSQPNMSDFNSCESVQGTNDSEVEILCDRNAGTDTPFLRRYTIPGVGAITTTDTELDGVTPYVVLGIAVPCDAEYVYDLACFRAIADSPIDYPVGGDPVGTAYEIGDIIQWKQSLDTTNFGGAFIKSAVAQNLSNGTYPTPFWFQLDGVDIVGSQPTAVDFEACDSVPEVLSARDLDPGLTGVLVKSGKGTIFDIEAFNINATDIAYLKIYDEPIAPVVGDTPIRTIGIPAQTGGAGFVIAFPAGINFEDGFGYRVTLAPADADVTAPAANEIILNFGYV